MIQRELPIMQPPRAVQVLHLVRKTWDTTALDSDMFAEFARAVQFYLRGFSVEDTADLVVQEFWEYMPKIGTE